MTYIFSALIIYIFIGLCLFVLQRRILYNTSGHPGSPKSYNLNNIKEINITTGDGIDLLSWYYLGDKN